MAVTINNTPQAFTPSDNPVWFTFSSDQTAETNFSFLVEVYINDTLVANELIFPDSGINGRFNAQSYASNACNSPQVVDGILIDALNYAQVKIKVIERYGDPIADGADATSANIYVFKARLSDDDFVDYLYTDYALPGASVDYLSDFPSNQTRLVKDYGEQQRLMVMTNEQTGYSFTVSLYDSDGVLIVASASIDVDEYWPITIFNVSPEQIVSFTAITQTNFDNSAYYVISFSSSLADLRIDIDRNCVYPHYKRIHWLSEIGSIESFTFALISRPSGNIKSFGYKQSWGEWDGSDFNLTKQQGKDIDFAKYSERSIVIESDWVNEYIQHWLNRSLYESPLVYEEIIDDSGSFSTILIRRKIMSTAWMDKYNLNDMLFKEKITLGQPSKTSMIL